MREQSRIDRNTKPPSISAASYLACRKTLMNQSAVTSFPVTDRVNQALEVTLRGVDELLPRDEWVQKLARSEATGVPLRIKLGLDPTAPDIHLGHTVVLNKMRQLQDLGHQVIFLIGDFTTLIGDPSGRNSTRPPLTAEQIKLNAETYYTQAAKVLDPARTEVRYNSEWCDQLGARGMIQLSAKYTVARMMERNDFHTRFTDGSSISLHEFLYPLLQGYDSVALKSDLELGGTDQKFNLMMGRHLQAEYGQEQQCVLTMPLLVGLDGVHKMSKSKNNYIGITEDANTMFAKVLSISDELMWDWYTCCPSRAWPRSLRSRPRSRPAAIPSMPRWRWPRRSPRAFTAPKPPMRPSRISSTAPRAASPTTSPS